MVIHNIQSNMIYLPLLLRVIVLLFYVNNWFTKLFLNLSSLFLYIFYKKPTKKHKRNNIQL